uniref:Uncharacterized protein n=1 Tax=Rhizophora mucronata TaxID=61149 RepID=A0A2P2IRC9_RHIMU
MMFLCFNDLSRRTSQYSFSKSSGDCTTSLILNWFQATSIPSTSSNAL